MPLESSWFKRRWFDFRQGHSIYLIFFLSFSNFILIFYRLLIERIDFLGNIFAELWVFIAAFVLVYVPIAIIIGAWHRRNQMKVDADVVLQQSPLFAKMFRILIDIQTERASKEDIEKVRKFLTSIEEKGTK